MQNTSEYDSEKDGNFDCILATKLFCQLNCREGKSPAFLHLLKSPVFNKFESDDNQTMIKVDLWHSNKPSCNILWNDDYKHTKQDGNLYIITFFETLWVWDHTLGVTKQFGDHPNLEHHQQKP